jgi:hypothetical protein
MFKNGSSSLDLKMCILCVKYTGFCMTGNAVVYTSGSKGFDNRVFTIF